MNAIEVVDVSKRFRRPSGGVPRRLRNLRTMGPPIEAWALRGVSFVVAPGETMGLIGSNGSGKSTLLRLIAGLTRPTTGAIAVHHNLSGLLTLGESFQPLLSGEENALTAAILAGLSRKEALARLEEVVAFAELEGHMDKPLRTFSDGMRLRLAFAVAVHTGPEILLLDEILAVGDLRFQEKCLGRLELLRERGSASSSPPITWRRCGASVIGWCGCPRGTCELLATSTTSPVATRTRCVRSGTGAAAGRSATPGNA